MVVVIKRKKYKYVVRRASNFQFVSMKNRPDTDPDPLFLFLTDPEHCYIPPPLSFVPFTGENIKKLLKLPFSKATVSMIVHRVGKTLLIDDFDIHKYLLRRSATEWEWLRRYFSQTVLQQIDKKEGAVVRKNCSSSALQERRLISKFLYRSLQHTPGQLSTGQEVEGGDEVGREGDPEGAHQSGRVASALR
jgi:hypothetical protein